MSILVSAAVLLVAAYARTFVHYAQFEWQETSLDGAYTHAWGALAVWVWLVWRAATPGLSIRHDSAPLSQWILVAIGAGMKWAGLALGFAALDGLSIVPLLLGVTGVLLDAASAKRLRFPILFLLAIVPLPNAAIDLVTAPMREWQSSAVAWLMQGAGVQRAGYSLLLGEGAGVRELVISGGCSGIRSLVAMSALAALLGHLQGVPPRRQFWLAIAVPVFVMAGNVLRLLVTTGAGLRWPVDVVMQVHDVAGFVVLPLVLGGLLLVARVLGSTEEPTHA
jgi:exosortase